MTAPLAYSDDGTGPDTVLLLHGQPGSAADWWAVARTLREQHRVIVPDRPGYGATGGSARGIRANARLALELLEELGVERATVAGHSWGSAVALAMTGDARVGGLVLVSPVSPTEPLDLSDRILADRRLGGPLSRAAFVLAGLVPATPPARRGLAAVLPGHDPDSWGPLARSWRSGEVWKSFAREQRRLVDELPGLAAEVRPLAVPAAVVVGRRDRITSPAAGRALGRALGARVVEVPGGGHLMPQRTPRVVARAIAATARRARDAG
ncbi:MAG: hypothetical protein QOJ07_3011 [Thermoleophilaceae bacterium]|nr:hypothetical protein [Thermoleophilaceae bacterium]